MYGLQSFVDWNEQIFKTQEENDLTDLYHVDIDGQTTGTVLAAIVFKKQNIHEFPYSPFKIHDEFIAISKDIKYVTGILFFLRPYIIDTEESDGKYLQNLPDRRYLVYATFGLQSVYNFWDRLGDMLYLFFPTKIKPNDVYFGRVFNEIAEEYKSSKAYIELKELYDEMKDILDLRHNSVHHFQIETLHYWGNTQHYDNDDERNKLNAEKFTYPDKLKRAMEVCNKAFVAALNLINELPDKPTEETNSEI
jgi:hypothetical protein